MQALNRAPIRAVLSTAPLGTRTPVVRVIPSSKIAALLETPSWSVKALLPPHTRSSPPTVTPAELHHLLRLSALPPPCTSEEESSMLETLESQIHFVKEIQKVDTNGVEPLRAIREETAEAIAGETVTMSDLQEYLDLEEKVGRNGRIKRRVFDDKEAAKAEDWKPAELTEGKMIGRYFFVTRESKMAKLEQDFEAKRTEP